MEVDVPKHTSNLIHCCIPQEQSETQLHTISTNVWHLTTKALGFTRFLVNMAYMEKVSFFYDFYNFGGIRSTQPTIPGR